MKRTHILLALLALLTVLLGTGRHTWAQADDLFFSEYIEGSSLNKALEIYNGTGGTVDLAAGTYSIEIYFNGVTSTGTTLDLTGTVADGDVYVVADDGAVAAILAETDQTTTSSLFNGDDAIVLKKGTTVLDAIGQIGFDPGSEWGSDDISTADNTLRRLPDICAGDADPSDAFDPAAEWEGFAIDNFDDLGSHVANCNGTTLTPPLINEFVFNHTGTDTNEFVEIAGDPNTDYSAFTIVEIEGDGDVAGVLDDAITVGTTGVTGYWTTGFQNNRFENGTVTLLLVEGYSGSVGQDLDSDDDGTLDATPWTGVVDSVAIFDGDTGDQTYGVALVPGYDGISFTVGGASRIPDQTDSDSPSDWVRNDFDGAGLPGFTGTPDPGEALNTPGATNELVPPPTVEVVINEIMQNPSAVFDDRGEWFELYNPGSSDVDVNGWTIADNDIDSHVINNGGPLSIPAGGYLVIGNNSDSTTNGGVPVDYSYGGATALANGADELVLFDTSATEIDRVEYDDGFTFPDPNGASMALRDPALDNNVGANWCTASTPYGAGDLGTPGAANDCAPPDLIINEIHADPDSTFGDANGDGVSHFSDDEFVEIVNNSDFDVDIGGWTISDGFSVRHVFPTGTVVPVDCSVVVFGGGTPTGDFGYSIVQTASSGALGFNNSGDTVTLATPGGAVIAAYTYGSEGGNNQSLTRDPDITGPEPLVLHSTATGSNGALFSPGTRIDGTRFGGCPIPDVCGAPATLIHDIQGDGAASPLQGQVVSIEGVVVGDFQYGDSGPDDVYDTDLDGFYVQEEDAEADANPLTSEGVFVFAESAPDVNIGDHVRVSGVVAEYSTSGGSLMTEISNVSQIQICGEAALPAVTEVTLPVSDVDDFERYEGMLVTFPQELVIAEYFNYDRFGEMVLATPTVAGRLFQPTSYLDDTGDIIAALDLIARSRITLDDGRSSQNPDPAIHPNGGIFTTADPANRFRGGDIVQNATGVLDDTFGLYRIQPVQGAAYTEANPRPAAPDDVGGSLQVASFNVLNYFLTLDDGVNDICGPDLNLECRGADTPEEFERQRTKILSALATIEADVFGLIEMENTTGVEPLADIVAGLNDMMGAGTYAYVDTGTIGTDAIKVGIIYRPATVTPLGSYAILDSSVDPRFEDNYNRPVLAQTFLDNESGGIFTVAVNHLKSKGSACEFGNDPYQGNCNLTRTLAAQAMVDWLATDPTGSGDTDFLITGDLNAYDKEDPIDAILAGPDDTLGTADDYVDLVAHFEGEYAYSYVFDGQLGYLDHALASPGLAGEVTGTTVWHINADEPDIVDYDMTFKQDAQDALYEPNPYRASDHDPVIVGLDLRVPDAQVTVSPDTLWPPNHKYVTVEANVIGDLANVALVSVISDEPDAGLDDEDLPNDIVILGDYTFDLRAERYDEGDGRTYTITYFVTGYQGDSTFVWATVLVPHDRRTE